MTVASPRVLSDRYELGDEVGRGGAGRVHRAHDRRLDRTVAVKVLTDVSDTAIARFRREAATAARVQHPNVVTLHDAGVDDVPYLVMRLVEGPSLATRVEQDGLLDPEAARRLASDLLAGLGATHAAGVLHRDLTPRNILFDEDGTALVSDFGIARGADDPTLTGAHTVMGTRPFVAPERLRGEEATVASDLFAAGVTLRYAITGSHSAPMPAGHRLAPLVAACTDADPARRPPSAAAAAAQLAQLTDLDDRLPDTQALPATEALAGPVGTPDGTTTDTTPADPRRAMVLVGAVALLVLLALVANTALQGDDPGDDPGPAASETPAASDVDEAPSFEVEDPAGSTRDLAEWIRDQAG